MCLHHLISPSQSFDLRSQKQIVSVYTFHDAEKTDDKRNSTIRKRVFSLLQVKIKSIRAEIKFLPVFSIDFSKESRKKNHSLIINDVDVPFDKNSDSPGQAKWISVWDRLRTEKR